MQLAIQVDLGLAQPCEDDCPVRVLGNLGELTCDQQLEVCCSLHNGHALVEDVERIERALVSSPSELLRHRESGGRPARERRETLSKPVVMVAE